MPSKTPSSQLLAPGGAIFFKISKWLLLLTPFTVIIVTTSTFFPFVVGKYVFFRTVIALAVVCFALGVLFDARAAEKYLKRLKRLLAQPLVFTVVAFVLIFVVAGMAGVDPWNSFFSNFERGEGGLQMLTFLGYFLLLLTLFRTKRDWRIFLVLIAVAAVGMILYGLAAGLKYIDAEWQVVTTPQGQQGRVLTGEGGGFYQTFQRFIGPQFSGGNYRFQGSIGNPAYVATYLMFALFFAGWLWLTSARQQQKLLLAALAAVFISFFVLAATRGAFLGLVGGVGAFLVAFGFLHKPWRRWTALLLLIAVLGTAVLVFWGDHPVVSALPFSRLFDISLAEETLQHRIIMWGIAWEAWQDRPWLGYGPENFIYAFDRYFDPAYFTPEENFGAWFDRAHSIFFDTLVATGVIGLAAFVGIFVALFQLLARAARAATTSAKVERALFVALPVAYLVQGLVLFDVSVIYLMLFAFLALAQFRFAQIGIEGNSIETHGNK